MIIDGPISAYYVHYAELFTYAHLRHPALTFVLSCTEPEFALANVGCWRS